MFVGLQVLLDVAYAVLNLMTVVDVQVAGFATGAFIHLYDGAEEFLHAHAVLERCGHHWHTKQRTECLQVYGIATPLKLIVHVQGTHQPDVHIYQLRREIEVTFEVRRVDDVDNHIRHLIREVLAHIELLGRIARQRIGAGQVDEVELVAEERCMRLGGIDSDA